MLPLIENLNSWSCWLPHMQTEVFLTRTGLGDREQRIKRFYILPFSSLSFGTCFSGGVFSGICKRERSRVTVRLTRFSGIFRVHHVCRQSSGPAGQSSTAALVRGMWCGHSEASLPLSRFMGLLVLSSKSSLKLLFILNISLIQS